MIDDQFASRVARRAAGLLAEFNRADVLSAADVHVATRTADLVGEPDQTVRLATALAVRAVRLGSVCVDL
ncbi:MAG TPA: exodeoxyribonuclease V subunit alpha, partial [Aeromicrobium sp.]|nr:exodeoxyribonuclease V subunit alpha [Aeromicrobium sp.]